MFAAHRQGPQQRCRVHRRVRVINPEVILLLEYSKDDKGKADASVEAFKQTSGSTNYVTNVMTNSVVDTTVRSGEDCLKMGDPINRLFSLAELQAGILSRKNSSPSQGNICYPVLKHLPRNALDRLLDL